MSNICFNNITITGDSTQLEDLRKKLLEQDPVLLKTIPNFTINPLYEFCISDKDCIGDIGDSLIFYFSSRYNSPINELTELSSEYPALEFHVVFEEAANSYYGEAIIYDGGCNETKYEELEFLELYNQDYLERLQEMNDTNYKDFLKTYTHDNFYDEHPFGYIDRHVVKRIKNKDLPRFINRQWFNDEAEEEFRLRLSGGSTEEPELRSDHVQATYP